MRVLVEFSVNIKKLVNQDKSRWIQSQVYGVSEMRRRRVNGQVEGEGISHTLQRHPIAASLEYPAGDGTKKYRDGSIGNGG